MHAPDGFLAPRVAIVAAITTIGVLALALKRSGTELDERQVPLAGLAAAFIFAAQMFNFPIAAGTSGHLLGGTLAAILLGPYLGALVVATVIFIQALLFADGGLTALGYNIINMAIVPAFAGWALFNLFRRVLPRDAGGVIGATALASGLSVVLAAMTFSLEWLFGATAPIPFDTVFTAMVGVHALIGIGEAVLSSLVVAAVLASRPEVVRGARDLAPETLVRRSKVSARTFAIGAFGVAAVFATVVSQFASPSPDGLERVAEQAGFGHTARAHALSGAPFAHYATRGVHNTTVSLAVAGLSGTILALLVVYGMAIASRGARTLVSEQP